jgi:hypothetical protein
MPEPGGYLTIERRDSLPVTGRLPGRSDQENVVFNRNPCGCPFSVPDPTIWPQMLIPVAELSTQLDSAEIRTHLARHPVVPLRKNASSR